MGFLLSRSGRLVVSGQGSLVALSLTEQGTAGRRQSLSGDDSIASWDFNSTMPTSPILRDSPSLRSGSESDPFANFSMPPSASFSARRRPGTVSSIDTFSSQPGASLRKREGSSTSFGGHRRGVSFDLADSDGRPPMSPRTANGFTHPGNEGESKVEEAEEGPPEVVSEEPAPLY